MARYTGPKIKISRREGADVFSKAKWSKRSGAPGVHPTTRGRKSEYAVQFREKQMIKRTYGMLERQFRKFYKMASKAHGNTGLRFLQLLELRLDNVVYRMGYAKSRIQARQFVAHGNVLVNGKKLDIPSFIVGVNDTVELKPKFAAIDQVKIITQETKDRQKITWIEGTKIIAEPPRDNIDPSFREQLVVEFYSK